MPIDFQFAPSSLSMGEMRELDYMVMAQAHASQNELGRLCDEKIYQADLAERLREIGLQNSYREVPLKASYEDFSMTYFLDLVVEGHAIYELKACSHLTENHTSQLLNYLFLSNSSRGKLINFRSSSVESRYVNSNFSTTQRRTFEIIRTNCKGEDSFIQLVVGLLEDWGVGLDLALYKNALIHLLGGDLAVSKSLPLTRGNILLGYQSFNLYSHNTPFSITSFSKIADPHILNLRKMLTLAKLDRFLWVNIGIGKVEFRIITA